MAKTQSKAKEEAAPQDSAGRVWPFEEIAPSVGPPWAGGAEITQSQLEELWHKKGQEEYELILNTLRDNGSITVVPDP